jgi:predicted DNA-binding ArsR family transcriptional regulator
MTTVRQQVLGVLSPGWEMSTNEVIEAVGRNSQSTRNALQILAKAGRVERYGRKPAQAPQGLRPWDQVEWKLAPKRRGQR